MRITNSSNRALELTASRRTTSFSIAPTLAPAAKRAPARSTSAHSRQMVSSDTWPFDQPRNCAVLITREILERGEPILHVTHDVDDHGWHFIGSTDGSTQNGRVISLHEAVDLDPSVVRVADLPVGWHAWRASVEEPWIREIIPDATSTI